MAAHETVCPLVLTYASIIASALRIGFPTRVRIRDPHAPWQRGTNENTNGLLRQYFPKGTDFPTVTQVHLDTVADELNDRPRKRLGFYKPTERLAELLLQ